MEAPSSFAERLVTYSNVLILFAAVLGLTYVYYARAFTYWSRQGLKGPKPVPILGNLNSFFSVQHEKEKENYVKFGRVHGKFEGAKPILVVGDPELLKVVMVKDFASFPDRRRIVIKHKIFSNFLTSLQGDRWRSARSIMTPTFTSGKMKEMFSTISSCSDALVERFNSTNGDIDLKTSYGCYTMDVIAKCCFATDTNSFKDKNHAFVRHAAAFFQSSTLRFFLVFMMPDFIRRTFKLTLQPSYISEFFGNVTRTVIKERRATGIKRNDFLQLMLDTSTGHQVTDKERKDEANDSAEAHHVNETNEDRKFFETSAETKELNDDEITANSVLFFVAGYETTGSLLTFLSHFLAVHQNVQTRLYKEIVQAFPDGQPNYEQLVKLPYMDAVISETLRIHPPVPRVERTVNEDYVLPGHDVTIKKGSVVQIPIWSIHHDPEFYPDPEQFDPSRFSPENRHLIKPYTYLPFGAGPRNCIGMRFALVEAKLALAKVLLSVRFERSPRTVHPLPFKASRGPLRVPEAIVSVKPRLDLAHGTKCV